MKELFYVEPLVNLWSGKRLTNWGKEKCSAEVTKSLKHTKRNTYIIFQIRPLFFESPDNSFIFSENRHHHHFTFSRLRPASSGCSLYSSAFSLVPSLKGLLPVSLQASSSEGISFCFLNFFLEWVKGLCLTNSIHKV